MAPQNVELQAHPVGPKAGSLPTSQAAKKVPDPDDVQIKIERARIESKSLIALIRDRVNDAKLAKLLEDDLGDEWSALQKTADYARFKPLILIIGDSTKKITEGMGYLPKGHADNKSKSGHAVFDTSKFSIKTIVEGIISLVEGLHTKPAIRKIFFDKFGAYLRARMRGGKADPAKAQPGKVNLVAPAVLKKREDEKYDQCIALVVGLLKLFAVLWPEISRDAKTERSFNEMWTTVIKPALGAATQVLTASTVLIVNNKKLFRKLAEGLRKDDAAFNEHLAERKDELEKRQNRALGKPDKPPGPPRKDDPVSDGATIAGRLGHFLQALGAVLEATCDFLDKKEIVFPSHIGGKWIVEAEHDPQITWTLNLKRSTGAKNAFEGTLVALGYPVGQSEARTMTEEKATVTVIHEPYVPDGGTLYFTWTPKALAVNARKLKCAADARFAGAEGVKERFTYHSPSWIGAEAAELCAPAGKKAALALTRNFKMSEWFGFFIATAKLAASATELVLAPFDPNKKKEWKQKVAEKVEDALEDLIPQKARRFIDKYLILKGGKAGDPPKSAITLGLKSPDAKYRLQGSWDLVGILDRLIEVLTGGPKVAERNPMLPLEVSGKANFGRVMAGIRYDEWNPNDKLASKAGKGLEDKLASMLAAAGIIDAKDGDLEAALAEQFECLGGLQFDLLAPKVLLNDPAQGEMPAVELPFVVYFKKLRWREEIPQDDKKAEPKYKDTWYEWPSKITFTVALSADQIAAWFPQIRACMFAAEVGWAIGTIARDNLRRFEFYRNGEEALQKRLAKELYGTDHHNSARALQARLFHLRKAGHSPISDIEAFTATAKVPIYLWRDVNAKEGLPPHWNYSMVYSYKNTMKEILERLKEEVPAPGKEEPKSSKNHPRRSWYVNTVGEAMTYAVLWDVEQASVAKANIEEELKKGDLHEALAERLKLYLDFANLTETGLKARLGMLSRKSAQKAAEVAAKHGKEHADYREWFRLNLICDPQVGPLYLKALCCRMPSLIHTDSVRLSPAKTGGLAWLVQRAEARELIRIDFMTSGGKRFICDTPRVADGPREYHRHVYEGKVPSERLAKFFKKNRSYWAEELEFTVVVRDRRQRQKTLFESGKFTLKVADNGIPTHYKNVGESKWHGVS